MKQPLSGIFVLDFTTLLPGPLATLMLAEAGAEILKIEKPGGEDMRGFAPLWQKESLPFALLNRGKQSRFLDLKSAEGQRDLQPLLERADILIEQFRPGVMDRLGIGFESLRKRYPRLIYCSITGYGQTGARAQEAGHDLNYIGQTGLLALQPGPAGSPVVPPALVADIGGGSFPAVINILLALRHRDQTGQGCRLDIAMTDAMFTFAWHAYAEKWAAEHPGGRTGLLTGGTPRYQLYTTQDGKLVACAALEAHFWRRFVAAIGIDAKHSDPDADAEETRAAIAQRIAEKTAAQWQPILAAADCCATIVVSLEDALRDTHFVSRGLFAHRVMAPSGDTLSALPVPIAPQFRVDPKDVKTFPAMKRD